LGLELALAWQNRIRASDQQVFLLGRILSVVAGVLEHEQPNRRRQIAMLALGVDGTHELRQVDMAIVRDPSECVPKDVFKADTGLVTAHHQGSFDHTRFEMAVVGFFGLFARTLGIVLYSARNRAL
jgi:hypothetical protein